MLEQQRISQPNNDNGRATCWTQLRELSRQSDSLTEDSSCHSRMLFERYVQIAHVSREATCLLEKVAASYGGDLDKENVVSAVLSASVDNKCDCAGVQLRDCQQLKTGVALLHVIARYTRREAMDLASSSQ